MTTSAIVWGTRRVTWEQVDHYGAAVIGHLKGQGIKPGDRVALCAPLSAEYIIVLFALWRMKAVACPINHRWPGQAVAAYISSIHASLLLTTVHMADVLKTVPARSLHIPDIVSFDARRDVARVPVWEPREDQEMSVIATSGSSGVPKAAVHTWANHYYNALGSQEMIPFTSEDRWLLALPVYHVSGLAILIRCYAAKAAAVIPVEDDVSDTIVRRQVTHASLVGLQAHRLLQSERGIQALKSLRYILLGGSAMSPALVEQCLSLGLNAFVSYGLTEMASQVATGKLGQCVRVLPHRELMISPDGEVLVRGKTLFKGYTQAGRTHLPLTPEGWFKTGDVGQMDPAGCLTIKGRKDNMFVSGGENIHPEEIEGALLAVEGVVEAVVVPKEDPAFGQRPAAFVRYQDGVQVPPERIIQHLSRTLPKFKIPTAFYPWPPGPSNLKPSRKEFQKLV